MRKIGAAVLVLALMATAALPVLAARSQNEAALSWLLGSQQADGGFTNGFAAGSDLGTTVEVILAGTAAGKDVSMWLSPQGASPLDYLAGQVQGGQVSGAANLSKVTLAAIAAGQDPRSFAGRDLIGALLKTQDAATGQFGDSLFAHAYAVLALRQAGATVPQNAIDLLKVNRTEDGGWAMFGGTTPGTADTNTTALAMQALAAVGEGDLASGALSYLQRMQNTDGGFPWQKPSAWGTETDANSTAVVLQALYALGEPASHWAASGTDPVGALLALWDATSGGYFWQASTPYANVMATAQAIQATEGMSLLRVSVVGAARAPQAAAVAPAAVAPAAAASDGTVLLPASGGMAVGPAFVVAGLLCLGGGWALRRKERRF